MYDKEFPQHIEDSKYFQNASVTIDTNGNADVGLYRIIVQFERWTGNRWYAYYDIQEFFDKERAVKFGKDTVKRITRKGTLI